MKKILSYIFIAGVAFIATACEKDSLLSGYEGGVSFDIEMQSSSSTRAGEGAGAGTTTDGSGSSENPPASNEPVISPINVRIYRPNGDNDAEYGTLIRRYSSIEAIPNPLYLVEGRYMIKVEGGNKSKNKAFKEPETEKERKEKLCYQGSNNFSIEAHQVNGSENKVVEVNCTPINVKTRVIFDRTIKYLPDRPTVPEYENHLFQDDVKITLAAVAFDENMMNVADITADKIKAEPVRLEFDAFNGDNRKKEEAGYFVLPDNVNHIFYLFEGTHETDGKIEYIGYLPVSRGYVYPINFRYVRTPDGFAGITLKLDTEPEKIVDQFYFKPQPELKATGIDLTAVNDYTRGTTVSLTCESINDLTKLSLNDEVFYENNVASQADIAGLTATKVEDTKVTITLSQDYFASVGGSLQTLQFKMWDSDTPANEPYTQEVKFRKSGIMDNSVQSYDLWGNKATIKAYINPADNSSNAVVKIKFRRADIAADATNNVYEVSATKLSTGVDEWAIETVKMDGENRVFPYYDPTANAEGHSIYKPNTATGIYAGNAYTYDLYIGDDFVDSYTLTVPLPTNQIISDGTFNQKLDCFEDGNVSSIWGSGNNSFTKSLCVYDSANGRAKLQATTAVGKLAAGNLFTGDFKMGTDMNGTVSFGIKYNWSARPTALKFNYGAYIGTVDKEGKYISGQDEASVLVAIVKWGSRHGVTSGVGTPSGMWSPDNGVNSVDEGVIVGYGLAYPTIETYDSETETISPTTYYVPIVYYNIEETAESISGANYSLVISFATSRYGDYMNGCSSSYMYIDDVEWHYGPITDKMPTFATDTY